MAASTAFANETRIFLIENSDGYGINSCLANGEPCGAEVANAWCRTHDYASALDFGRIAITGSSGTSASSGIATVANGSTGQAPACTGAKCEPVVAIACTR
ncbi:hypothetical protein ACLBXM_04160 [Xanthobacteraceae bacterium A53D]